VTYHFFTVLCAAGNNANQATARSPFAFGSNSGMYW